MKRDAANNLNKIKKIKKDHPFFNINSKSSSQIQWTCLKDSLLIAKTKKNKLDNEKFAAFDLDGTLITTKSGRVFPKDEHDWRWWNPNIPKRLERLYQDGYGIVIFSNQNGLNNDKKIKGFQLKVEAILNQLESPVVLLAALKKDVYRKPMTGMWDWLVDNTQVLDKASCFFVGDAAGREHIKGKDHSCADRKFAQNISIGFHTPEEYFLSEPKMKFSWNGFNAKEHIQQQLPLYEPNDKPLVPNQGSEVIVCVGYPASGKSSFVKTHLSNYTYINQDTLKTKEKCLLGCKKALDRNESVVIDNTNPEAATRKLYIQLANQAKVPVRCFYFGDNEGLAQHNNYYRAIQKPEEKREVLSSMVFRMFKSKFQEPTLDEGFADILNINFVFNGSDQEKEQWQKWWY